MLFLELTGHMKEKYFAKPSFNQSTLCVKLEIWAKSKLLLFLVFLECIGFFGFFWPIVFLLECIGVSVGAWRPLLLRSPPVASWTSGPGRAGLLPVLCRAPPGAPSSRATCTKAAPYSLFWCWCTKPYTKSCTKLSTTWCTKQIIVLIAPKLLCIPCSGAGGAFGATGATNRATCTKNCSSISGAAVKLEEGGDEELGHARGDQPIFHHSLARRKMLIS